MASTKTTSKTMNKSVVHSRSPSSRQHSAQQAVLKAAILKDELKNKTNPALKTKSEVDHKATLKATPEAKDKLTASQVIKYPLSTEKSIRAIEFENKISFVVDRRATKTDVKHAVEELFNVKVAKVNMQNSFTGQKRAYVKLTSAHSASDLSADLGLI